MIKEFPPGRPPRGGEVNQAIARSDDDFRGIFLKPRVERVDGSLVAKDRPEEIRPENKLETGSLVEQFPQRPQEHQLHSAIARSGRSMPRMIGNGLRHDVETKKGNVLDEDVQIGR